MCVSFADVARLGRANIAELIGTDPARTVAAPPGQHPLSDYPANVGFLRLPLFQNAFHVSAPHNGISSNLGSHDLAGMTVDPSQPYVDVTCRRSPAPVGFSMPNRTTRYRLHDKL
jgi:hypothetical protein